MSILQIGISVFVFIECLNVLMLYFVPESKKGNGVGIFNAYEESKKDESVSRFVEYLINWVAGAKLIFIMIGIVVVIFGNYYTQLFTCLALILSILSFYYRLFPEIKKMDSLGEISPKGYYKTLNYMILSFIVGFIVVFVISIFN
jgi:hypothetical protein